VSNGRLVVALHVTLHVVTDHRPIALGFLSAVRELASFIVLSLLVG